MNEKKENIAPMHACQTLLFPRLDRKENWSIPPWERLVERRRNAVDAGVEVVGKRSAVVVELNFLGVDLRAPGQLCGLK